jgi:xanthine dehydrogenase large subunit
VRATPGVVAVLTAADIPGVNDCGPIVHDDPVLADGVVQFVGQPMFIVVATSHDIARLAARARSTTKSCPRSSPRRRAQRRVVRHAAAEARARRRARAARGGRASRAGEMYLGGQEQFYLEGQIAYAVPKDDDGMHVYCSTQHPSEMQHLVAHVLGVASHDVLVECRRMGGGFGGKESQSGLFACCAALAAWKLLCPVKLRPDRDDDMMITGKRHDFHYRFDVGYDDDGRIDGVALDMTSRCGFSADLSGPVMTRAVCHFDNAYWLATWPSPATAARPTRSRTPRSAASAARRARSRSSTSSTTSRARSAAIRSTCAARTSTARPSAT